MYVLFSLSYKRKTYQFSVQYNVIGFLVDLTTNPNLFLDSLPLCYRSIIGVFSAKNTSKILCRTCAGQRQKITVSNPLEFDNIMSIHSNV